MTTIQQLDVVETRKDVPYLLYGPEGLDLIGNVPAGTIGVVFDVDNTHAVVAFQDPAIKTPVALESLISLHPIRWSK